MSYSKKILYYCNDNKNIGEFDFNDFIGIGLVGSPACGDIIKFQILVLNNFISDVKYKTYGCGSAIAATALLSNYIKGLKLYQALLIKNIYISQELKLPLIKLHCSILVEEVLLLTINNYKNNYLIYF